MRQAACGDKQHGAARRQQGNPPGGIHGLHPQCCCFALSCPAVLWQRQGVGRQAMSSQAAAAAAALLLRCPQSAGRDARRRPLTPPAHCCAAQLVMRTQPVPEPAQAAAAVPPAPVAAPAAAAPPPQQPAAAAAASPAWRRPWLPWLRCRRSVSSGFLLLPAFTSPANSVDTAKIEPKPTPPAMLPAHDTQDGTLALLCMHRSCASPHPT